MAPIDINNKKLKGLPERILKTREVDMGIDPATGRRMVKLVIDDPNHYCGSSGSGGNPDFYNKYINEGRNSIDESMFSADLASIHNWDLYQKTLPKTKLETEIRKEFLPKNKISNNPVKIEKKKQEKNKNDIKKVDSTFLKAIKNIAVFIFPFSVLQQIIKKNGKDTTKNKSKR
jgi:hypothetical protein